MGINVIRETEFGEQEEVVPDPMGFLPTLLNRCLDRQWVVIQSIDYYGNTVFNRLQVPMLLDDLRGLKDYAESADERAFLEAVLGLIERTKNQVHSYVKFYGD